MASSTPADDASHEPVDPVRIHGTPVYGVDVQPDTRCAHYHGRTDIIAIRFPCCDRFYPCHACHQAAADHDLARWPASAVEEPAVLCGQCGTVLSIRQYLLSSDTCPECSSAFNPGCMRHHHLYFEPTSDEENIAGVDKHTSSA